MSKLLYSQSTQQTLGYPRSDGEPVIGLDPDFLVLTQVNTDPPEITENQSLSSTYVVDVNALEYRQEWAITTKPLPEPVPDWDGFNGFILSNVEFNTYYGTGLGTAPAVTSSLPAALAQVSTNGFGAFAMVFNGFCTVAGVTSIHRGEWADMAERFNLPTDFVAIVRSLP
jgi:hypothetical protein